MEPLFPEYNLNITYDGKVNRIYLTTVVRKKFGRKWYLQRITRPYEVHPKESISADIIECIQHFIREVYKVIVLSKLDKEITDINTGKKIMWLDNDQRNEVEKIIDRYCKV